MKQFKLILRPVAVILTVQAVFMALCGVLAVILGEWESALAFLKAIAAVAVIDGITFFISRSAKRADLSARSGFLLVTFVWICVSVFGALPYVLSLSIPSFADALFESVSGFTTTGATVLTDIEALPQSMLLWRGLTHWIGGGGIIVLSVAILPLLGIGGMHLMKAETTGLKVDKLAPRIAETAKYLWFLYCGLTGVVVVLLLLGGMGIIDALCHAFSAISTGGLSSRNDSVAYFNSAYIDWVLIIAMIVGAINFVLIIKVLHGGASYVKHDSEFKAFILIIIVATAIVTVSTYYDARYSSWSDAIRYAAFQVVSILSTTGFATDDYEMWPAAAQVVIFLLFFIGGCSGSTSGGIKVVRHVVMFKQLGREIKYLLHPKAVAVFRLNGEPARSGLVNAVAAFIFIYIVSLFVLALALAVSGIDVFTSFIAVLGTLSTVGPGFGEVGPTKNYGHLSDYAKYILSFAMLLGRLEIYTLLVLFTPRFWKR